MKVGHCGLVCVSRGGPDRSASCGRGPGRITAVTLAEATHGVEVDEAVRQSVDLDDVPTDLAAAARRDGVARSPTTPRNSFKGVPIPGTSTASDLIAGFQPAMAAAGQWAH